MRLEGMITDTQWPPTEVLFAADNMLRSPFFNRRPLFAAQQMSEFPPVDVPDESATSDMAAALENFKKKKNPLMSGAAVTTRPPASATVTTGNSLVGAGTASSATQQVASASSSRSVAKRVAHHSSSSHLSSSHQVTSSELKASSMKSDLSELKSSISEMKNLSSSVTTTQQSNFSSSSRSSSAASSATLSAAAAALANPASVSEFLRNSIEQLDVDDDGGGVNDNDMTNGEPVITFPEPDTPNTPPAIGALTSPNLVVNSMALAGTNNSATTASASEMKFEQKRVASSTKTKVITDSFSAEQASANSAEVRRLHAGEMSFQQQTNQAAVRARLEMDGITAEKSSALKQENRSIKSSEVTQQESQNIAASSVRLQTDSFSAEKKNITAQQQSARTVFNQEQHVSASSQSSNFTSIVTKGVCTKSSSASVHASSSSSSSSQMSQLVNGVGLLSVEDEATSAQLFDELERLSLISTPQDVERAIQKCEAYLNTYIQRLRKPSEAAAAPQLLGCVNELMRKAWAVPTHGHELGYSLCNSLRNCGGLDLLISNCIQSDAALQFASARLLEQCLTTENRAHVVEKGLEKVVHVACVCTKHANSVEHSRVGTGILEHLFKHSEGTCSDVIHLGGLDAVLFECRKNDIETLRHCAGALANLSLYGGADNQEAMIKRKVPMWLFPLAFHDDDNIKYYACLAIAVLVANKEIEAAVLQSGTLDLVEPFVMSHNPSEFAKSNLAHAHGQSKNWLQRLVPVLSSKREAARNLAAFHFCMEAGIKEQQGNTELFKEIGAIEPLKKVASCPNAVASKYAARALRLMGEEVPHKLSQQVPLWSTEDVREWVKQIGFAEYAQNFVESRVDGDLLLQLNETNLSDDIGITNGIRRRRFTRELQNLKKMADYSSRDASNLNTLLQGIGADFSIYTYSMLNAGVDKDSIRIHRQRIMSNIRQLENTLLSASQEDLNKSLDVFGFSVFIDVERLEAGKFDNNLLQSIRQAKHFLLVLTPKALDRCINDVDCKDWVHREIVAALQSQCNIIPIIDNFQWPEPEQLPEDMRAVCHFNGVRWIHDYQDACVEKLERFLRGEFNPRSVASSIQGGFPGHKGDSVTPGTPTSTLGRHPPTYQRMHSSDSGKGGSSSDASKDINDGPASAARLARLRQQQSRRPPASPSSSRMRRYLPNFATRSSAHPTHSSSAVTATLPCPPARGVPPPSRTHSLDVLDSRDSSTPEPGQSSSDEAAVVSACEQYLSAAELSRATSPPPAASDVAPRSSIRASLLGRALSCDETSRDHSGSALSLTSASSEPKRKRNFMDRCVNKVRSLIRK
ncbi:hypothetical protein B566_EDAN015480 [Ephemera danica]|nr:hypothetical protein B566_EDAN015480 [Ephemera danica]